MIRVLLLVFATLSITTAAHPATKAVTQLRRETLDIVWSRVNEYYYDPTFNGVDWNAVKAKYLRILPSIKNDDQFYGLINSMLDELKRSHFAIIPPSVYIDEIEGKSADSDIGMTVQIVEGDFTITKVAQGSPAQKAGLRPGFIVTHIMGRRLSVLEAKIEARKERPAMSGFILSAVAGAFLSGVDGSWVSIQYIDGKGDYHTATVKRRKSEGELVKLGEMPAIYASMETRRLDNGIGYVHFNAFMVPLLDKIKDAIRSYKDAPGIIIDLRGNPGGVGAMALPIAAMFCHEQTLLGTMKLRNGEIRFLVYPVTDPYMGQLVFLTDETSASTAEILAGGLQECGRAKVVGQPSVGAVMPALIEKLPIGARLQYAVADFKTPKEVMLEGRGVLPDIEVNITRNALLAGHDPVLDAAISLILKQ